MRPATVELETLLAEAVRESAVQVASLYYPDAAVILDGRVPHAILLELFTGAGPGTLIRAS